MLLCKMWREIERKKGKKKRETTIKTVKIQGVDRKTGTPYNILQSNTTAMQKPLEVHLV